MGGYAGIAAIYYALLMYFLYATTFSERGAVNIASFERYMNSFVISVFLLFVALFFDSEIWKKATPVKVYWIILIVLLFDLRFHHINAFEQILPGNVTHDDEKVSYYTEIAENIVNCSDEESRIYIVKRGDNGDFVVHQRYYCYPRIVNGGSIGPKVDKDDAFSSDIASDEFRELLTEYDYLYLSDIDNAFIEQYAAVFDDVDLLRQGQLYKITDYHEKIGLEAVGF